MLLCLSVRRNVTTVNICYSAPGAIAVAPTIWIVQATENRNSYGNTIELYFLLNGLNLLLKNLVNNVCLRPFHVRTSECICLWPSFQSVRLSVLWHRSLGSVWLTSWILLHGTILWYQTESGESNSIVLAPLALIWEGAQLASYYLLKAWARPQLANLTEYTVREGYVKAHWLSMLMQ